MSNTPLPYAAETLDTPRALIESLQSPRLRAGGPSSSGILNRLLTCVKRDLLRLAVESADTSDQARVLALAVHAQNAGLSRQYQALQAELAGISANSGADRATADLFGNALTVSDGSLTSCDVSPLFGQATLPALSRQNLLEVDRSGVAVSFALQPGVTSTSGASAPPDYAFGEDDYAVFALDPSSVCPWIVEDPTPAPHVAWVQLSVPGGAGSGRCNEFEFVPNPCFTSSLFSVQAEVPGQGWTDVDFSYLGGYDAATRSVKGLGPSRLCFAESSVTRFRLGLWTAGPFGFSSLRVLRAVYGPSALLTVDFSPVAHPPLTRVLLSGKDPARLGYLGVTTSGGLVTVGMSPLGPSSETPVICSVSAQW